MTTAVGFEKVTDYSARFKGLVLEQFKGVTNAPTKWIPVDGVANWKHIAVNRNTGRFRLAVAYNAVYRSDDYGVTYTIISGDDGEPLPTAAWWTCAISRDGHFQYVSEGRDNVLGGGGYIWRSADFGVTWTKVTAIADPTRLWASITVDENGQNVVAVVHNWTANGISYSNDFGVTWTTVSITGRDWIDVKSTADGQTVVAAADTRELWISYDAGATWAIFNSNYRRWNTIAFSDDFQYITVTTHINDDSEIPAGNGLVWQSDDSGATWTSQTPSGAPNQWSGSEMTADGKHQYLILNGHDPVVGHVWISDDYGVTFTEDLSSPSLEYWQIALTSFGNLYFTVVATGSPILNYHLKNPVPTAQEPVEYSPPTNTALGFSTISDYTARAKSLIIEQLKMIYNPQDTTTTYDWQDSDTGQEYADGDVGQEYQEK